MTLSGVAVLEYHRQGRWWFINRLSEQMNKAMYVLSIVAAIFLPLGLLTGLLGINVGGIPGTESPFAFAIVSLFLVVIAILLIWHFKRLKWL